MLHGGEKYNVCDSRGRRRLALRRRGQCDGGENDAKLSELITGAIRMLEADMTRS